MDKEAVEAVGYLVTKTNLLSPLASIVFEYSPFDFIAERFALLLSKCELIIDDYPDGYQMSVSLNWMCIDPMDECRICVNLRPPGASLWHENTAILSKKIHNLQLFPHQALPFANMDKLMRLQLLLRNMVNDFSP